MRKIFKFTFEFLPSDSLFVNYSIGGDVDITLACYTGAKFEWVVTGPVKLVIEITPNQYLSGPVDAVMANNRHSVDVNVDCEFG